MVSKTSGNILAGYQEPEKKESPVSITRRLALAIGSKPAQLQALERQFGKDNVAFDADAPDKFMVRENTNDSWQKVDPKGIDAGDFLEVIPKAIVSSFTLGAAPAEIGRQLIGNKILGTDTGIDVKEVVQEGIAGVLTPVIGKGIAKTTKNIPIINKITSMLDTMPKKKVTSPEAIEKIEKKLASKISPEIEDIIKQQEAVTPPRQELEAFKLPKQDKVAQELEQTAQKQVDDQADALISDQMENITRQQLKDTVVPEQVRTISQKPLSQLTPDELVQLRNTPVTEIAAAKFAAPDEKFYQREIYNALEASGIDDSIGQHLVKRSRQGVNIDVSADASRLAPQRIASEMIPKIRTNIEKLNQFASKQWKEAWEKIPQATKTRKIDTTDLFKQIEEAKVFSPDVERVLNSVGLQPGKKYSLDQLNNIKSQLSKHVSSFYKRETMGTQQLQIDPVVQSLRNIDGNIRQIINNNSDGFLKPANQTYREIHGATDLLRYRLQPGRAERFVKALKDPDWKTERIVEPLQMAEAAMMKYSDRAGTTGFFDDLMDQMASLTLGQREKTVALPGVKNILKYIPVLGKPIGEAISPTAQTFSRMVATMEKLQAPQLEGKGILPALKNITSQAQKTIQRTKPITTAVGKKTKQIVSRQTYKPITDMTFSNIIMNKIYNDRNLNENE